MQSRKYVGVSPCMVLTVSSLDNVSLEDIVSLQEMLSCICQLYIPSILSSSRTN